MSARKSELAVWVREGLVRLGPTFIKIGQQFSTRVDVLSPEFIKELEKLQVGEETAGGFCSGSASFCDVQCTQCWGSESSMRANYVRVLAQSSLALIL